jgi:transcriptional regulator with XRE-family HTH domain
VNQPVEYMSVGERIAIYRRRRGLSQLALANMIGRSEAWLSQVERGIRHVDRVSVLIRLAQVLRVTVEDLIGQPLSLAPNGGIEFRAIPVLRAALTDYEVIPATFGVAMGDGRPIRDLPSLRRNVDQANRLYQAAHYEEAGLLCSRLISDAQRAARELTGDDRRGAFGVLAESYHITAKTLTKVGETELAWIAAERSLPAAQSAELPLLLAASAYHLGHVFLRASQVEQAAGVAMTAARALEPGLATATPEHLSAWGALHLTALIAAARQDDRVAVRQLLGEARATAARLGQDRNDFWTAFGPTNVALHEVSTAVELGDAGEVVRKGEALDSSGFPPGLVGRRAQVFIDLARGYTQQRKDAAAVNMLLEAERIAPEAVRYQIIVKEMLRELLRREHRASTPQLRSLAARVSIIREDTS